MMLALHFKLLIISKISLNTDFVISQFFYRLKQQYHFNNELEEDEYFKRIDNKIEDLKHNKYVKLPFYTVDIKRFFPYVDELRSTVLKFKPEILYQSQSIMNNIKEKYAKVCIRFCFNEILLS